MHPLELKAIEEWGFPPDLVKLSFDAFAKLHVQGDLGKLAPVSAYAFDFIEFLSEQSAAVDVGETEQEDNQDVGYEIIPDSEEVSEEDILVKPSDVADSGTDEDFIADPESEVGLVCRNTATTR